MIRLIDKERLTTIPCVRLTEEVLISVSNLFMHMLYVKDFRIDFSNTSLLMWGLEYGILKRNLQRCILIIGISKYGFNNSKLYEFFLYTFS